MALGALASSGCGADEAPDPDDSLAETRDGTQILCVPPTHSSDEMSSEHQKVMALLSDPTTHRAIASGDWNVAGTWDNGVPTADAHVVIAPGVFVTLRTVETALLRTLSVEGTLTFDTTVDTGLLVDTMIVKSTGTLEMGTAATPVADGRTATITFNGGTDIDRTWDPWGFSRGLISHGTVHVHGKEVTSFLRVTSATTAGTSTLTLASPPSGWSVGDRVVLTGTDPANSNDSEGRAIVSVSGNVVELDGPLTYSHTVPEAGLTPYLANLTRNVRFQSQDADYRRRGHVMLMHSDIVDISGAGFYKLGRTNKDLPIDDAVVMANALLPPSGTNVRGRYALHFHRTGIWNPCAPVVVRDSVVDDSPGWGFVNHSSTVHFEDNVAHNVRGAGFVTEAGDEQGTFEHNLAVKSNAIGGPMDARIAIQDFGYEGWGFWFQGGGGVHATNNVAADQHAGGFVVYGHGLNQSGLGVTRFPTAFLADGSWANGAATVAIELTPVPELKGNETFDAPTGLVTTFHLLFAPHEQRTVVEDFKVWNLASFGTAVALPYTNQLTLKSSVLLGKVSNPSGQGISGTNATANIDLEDVRMDGFALGMWVPMQGHNHIVGGVFNNSTNFDIPTLGSGDRLTDFSGPIQISTPGAGYDIDKIGDLVTQWFSFPTLFDKDRVLLNFGPHAGKQVYFAEQGSGFVPFPSGSAQSFVPAAVLGKTNLEMWTQYGVALYGAIAPDDATTDPTIDGLIGAPFVYPPALKLVSSQQVGVSANYQLVYRDAQNNTITDPQLTNLSVGWNLITRVIGGMNRSFFVHNSGASDPPPPPPPPSANCTTIRRGVLGSVADTQNGSGNKSGTNWGAGLAINTGNVGGTARQTLLSFDLGVLPASITLTSATLSLQARAGYTNVATINVHESLAPWAENTVTWTSYYANPAPQVGPVLASLATTGSSYVAPLEWDITSLVADWLSGAKPNRGVLLEQGGANYTNFYTSEEPTASARPALIVCFTQ